MTEPNGLRRLVREMHRRSLWQVMAVYLAASWAVFEAVQGIVDAVNLPEWLPALALILLLIGFPVVLATAIVQEGVGGEPATGTAPSIHGATSEPGATTASADDGVGSARPTSPQLPSSGAARWLTWRNALLGGVSAFALWGVIAAAYLLGARGLPEAAAGPDARSTGPDALRAIAVLPFDNLSTEAENAFFADGIHEDVLTQLSKIGDLTVISRTSVMHYRETDKSLREIATELDVGTVLEGSVRRAGDNVRITAQLIDASNDRHLWADNFDRELTAANVFAIQSEIARRIADALQATLSPQEASRIAATPTDNLTAYDFVLQGRAAYRQYTDAANDEAIRLFKEALRLDSGFADAWAGMADAYAQRTLRYGYDAVWVDSAQAMADRAIEADPESARAYKALALVAGTRGRWSRSTELNLRAVELDPNFSDAINNVGSGMWSVGRIDEALRWFGRSFRIDPNNPFARSNVGSSLVLLGDFAAAEAWLAEALKIDPDNEAAHSALIELDLSRGRVDEAADRGDRLVELLPGSPRVLAYAAMADVFAHRYASAAARATESAAGSPTQGFVIWYTAQVLAGFAYLRVGDEVRGERFLDDALARRTASVEAGDEYARHHWEIATVHAIRGERDRAIAWAERAIEAGFRAANMTDHDPMWDGMRDDPRFQRLLAGLHTVVREQREGASADNRLESVIGR